MDGNLNVQALGEQIGALKNELENEKSVRTAAQSDLEAANTAHTDEIANLKAAHTEELENLKTEKAKEVTALSDKLQAATERVSQLEADAKTASEQAADILSQAGGSAASPEGDDDNGSPAPLTQAEHQKLLEQQRALPIDQRHSFYKEKIAPRLNR